MGAPDSAWRGGAISSSTALLGCLRSAWRGWRHAEFLADNPYDTLTLGCDFVRNHTVPQIDFATIHLWPDSWLPGGASSEEAALRFARRWINSHVDACARLGKPLVLSEFGKKPAGPERAAFYEKVRGTTQTARVTTLSTPTPFQDKGSIQGGV